MDNNEKQIQIKFTDEVAKGVYANNVEASFNKEEFILNFLNILPPIGMMTARVIMSPSHVKRVSMMLARMVEKYESLHGDIKDAKGEDGAMIGFDTK
jgi:hypothetical protein